MVIFQPSYPQRQRQPSQGRLQYSSPFPRSTLHQAGFHTSAPRLQISTFSPSITCQMTIHRSPKVKKAIYRFPRMSLDGKHIP